MAAKNDYGDRLRKESAALIESLELDIMQKRFLLSRWLDQVVWMERKAGEAQRRYYRLRLTTVIGAVVVPALVSLQGVDGTAGDLVQVATAVVSLVVAISAAIEQFFRFGERWQHYRRTVERLKSEGWLYFELSGDYRRDGASHDSLFSEFAERVEELLRSDVDAFVTEIAAERKGGQGQAAGAN